MTDPTPTDAVRAALAALQNPTGEEVAVATTRALADALLPRPATGDRSPRADSERLLILQFLTLANELAGNPPPAASREALAEAREEFQAAAWQGIEPEQVLPAVEALAAAIEPTPSAPALPPALVLDGGDGVRISATSPERTDWVIQREVSFYWEYLSTDGQWCIMSWLSDCSDDFLGRTRWPSAKAAWDALLEYRAGEGVEG